MLLMLCTLKFEDYNRFRSGTWLEYRATLTWYQQRPGVSVGNKPWSVEL